MDGARAASSPFPDAAQVPIQRNPPLAPSQELAYRNKCIQLKKRLVDIEKNNDATRRLIAAEKERVQKQRLLRALLLNQLREIMETPGKKFSAEELEKLGIVTNGDVEGDDLPSRQRPEGEALLDDSSDNSDEDIPEPSDRPTRSRRPGANPYRGEAVMSNQQQTTNTSQYPSSTLPAIAPAHAYSPAPAREQLTAASSFKTPSGAVGGGSPRQHVASHRSQFGQDSHYTHSSPIHSRPSEGVSLGMSRGHPETRTGRSISSSDGYAQPSPERQEANGFRRDTSTVLRPDLPPEPYKQFYDHMKPQLEADNYPPHQMQDRIDEEWRNLSTENRDLWEVRYREQMREYDEAMEVWRKMTSQQYR